MSVLGTGTPVPTEAVPCRVTCPGGETFTAPSGGAVMFTEIEVPPGRLPSSARAHGAGAPNSARRTRAAPRRARPLLILPPDWRKSRLPGEGCVRESRRGLRPRGQRAFRFPAHRRIGVGGSLFDGEPSLVAGERREPAQRRAADAGVRVL